MMSRITTIGELLIDFIPKQRGVALIDVTDFSKKPGGAPANVAVVAAKLGAKSALISQVGDDAFGHGLIRTIKGYGVDTGNLFVSDRANTALAFVTLDHQGNRDFVFYRNPSADQLLETKQIAVFPEKGDILHFCSVSLSDHPIKNTHVEIIKRFKDVGGLISFDPNVRLGLFQDHVYLQKTIRAFLGYADFVKVAEDEIEFITGEVDETKALAMLKAYGPTYIIVTRGRHGASLYTGDRHYHMPSFVVKAVDTTGAGDAFIGAFLSRLAKHVPTLDEEKQWIPKYLEYANAAAALTVTKEGAMDGAPSAIEIDRFLKEHE
jgi:fructokinase